MMNLNSEAKEAFLEIRSELLHAMENLDPCDFAALLNAVKDHCELILETSEDGEND